MPDLAWAASAAAPGKLTVVRDIYSHTIDVILAATALGGYRALPEQDIFDVEYWDLEQAKLKKAGAPRAFAGEVGSGHRRGIGYRQGLRRSRC
jgi:hypothetical protein